MPLAFVTLCVTPAWRIRRHRTVGLLWQVSAVQKKWYARRYNIGTFNRAFEETGNVFFFFSVTHSYNFQVCLCVSAYMRTSKYMCVVYVRLCYYVCVCISKVCKTIMSVLLSGATVPAV